MIKQEKIHLMWNKIVKIWTKIIPRASNKNDLFLANFGYLPDFCYWIEGVGVVAMRSLSAHEQLALLEIKEEFPVFECPEIGRERFCTRRGDNMSSWFDVRLENSVRGYTGPLIIAGMYKGSMSLLIGSFKRLGEGCDITVHRTLARIKA